VAEGRVNGATQIQVEGDATWTTVAALPRLTAPASPSAPPPIAAKTSVLAICSLVLGILGLFTCGLTALVGLILGIIALVKIKHSRGALGGNGLAWGGTIVSGVLVLLIPMMAAMMLPALAAAHKKAQLINCVNNEKQLAIAVRIYTGNHGDHFPPAATWCDAIKPEVGTDNAFKCPAVNTVTMDASTVGKHCDYAFNAKLDGLDASTVNPKTVLLFEGDAGWNGHGGPELIPVPLRHHELVVALADGSVQMVKPADLATLRWDP